jgi:hypothetical protein
LVTSLFPLLSTVLFMLAASAAFYEYDNWPRRLLYSYPPGEVSGSLARVAELTMSANGSALLLSMLLVVARAVQSPRRGRWGWVFTRLVLTIGIGALAGWLLAQDLGGTREWIMLWREQP